MKEVVVLSGKGGTGKTSIVGSFAALAQNKVLCDCDVDAADLHLLLRPQSSEKCEFRSGQTAFIDEQKCSRCWLCEDNCRFDAISDFTVDPASCEGCAFCSHICPEEAIEMQENLSGHWFISDTEYGPLVHARLGIAEENSGKLVTTVRNESKLIAERQGLDIIITDGPPGIGCPVISSLSGANLALIVTEPTLSGMHDLERVVGVCQHFKIPIMVCINKYDINEENTRLIESMCADQGIDMAARIPFDDMVTEALTRGLPVVEYSKGEVADTISALWESVLGVLTA
ncbi:MAG: ATP-binding protein [Chloroflexota bacterium]|nr:ATP-binding protein [Chloroflexota bacterium]